MLIMSFSLILHSSSFRSLAIFILLFIIISSAYVLSGERRRSSSPSAPSIRHALMKIKTRTPPDMSLMLSEDPHMFSVVPRHFLPEVKNPCWYEEYHGDGSSDPYASNLFGHYFHHMRGVFQRLRRTFTKHLRVGDGGELYRFRCLPYFYIIGQPKCGTTDVFNRLRLHPDVRLASLKEPHWWSRKRYGIMGSAGGVHTHYGLQDYLDLFDLAAADIQDSSSHIITGEGSASTMWDNNAWFHLHDNSTEAEPPLLNQDFIHGLQPDARLIVILRDPVERLYSDYLYFGVSDKSSDDFHVKVSESVMMFNGCVQHSSLRSCVYNRTLYNAMRIQDSRFKGALLA
ncbi:carbohydrate sulfotransferase 15-like isoform X2 [Triplophysa dalaica]|uniref:carbohydrate sulfotransferase 15-like isoform X2 n=1 Tax=Triplophysa dalaica TaxID=1582913 RepID=UPI0024DFBEEA|nr:carbohydrate sulfotransferase 15-like isoform X2 [Triplophysa dalaica]